MNAPAFIKHGIVQDIHHLMDFGRIEARVRLYLAQTEANHPGVELVANVAYLPSEALDLLKTRLVIRAARLFRQCEQLELGDPSTRNQIRAA